MEGLNRMINFQDDIDVSEIPPPPIFRMIMDALNHAIMKDAGVVQNALRHMLRKYVQFLVDLNGLFMVLTIRRKWI